MTSPKQLAERALELYKSAYSYKSDDHLVGMVPALATEVLKLLEENAVMREALDFALMRTEEQPPIHKVAIKAREALRKADGIRNGEKQ